MISPVRRPPVGRTVAALATALIPATLTLAVVRTGSATDLGLALSCELLPMLVLLPVAGVVADRFPPLTADLIRPGVPNARREASSDRASYRDNTPAQPTGAS